MYFWWKKTYMYSVESLLKQFNYFRIKFGILYRSLYPLQWAYTYTHIAQVRFFFCKWLRNSNCVHEKNKVASLRKVFQLNYKKTVDAHGSVISLTVFSFLLTYFLILYCFSLFLSLSFWPITYYYIYLVVYCHKDRHYAHE